MDADRYLVEERTGFLVTHSGSSFVNFLYGLPLEPFTLDLHYLWLWTFLPNLLHIKFDLEDDPTPDPLPFPLL